MRGREAWLSYGRVSTPLSLFFISISFFIAFSLNISKIAIFQQRVGVPEGCPGFNSFFAFVSFR